MLSFITMANKHFMLLSFLCLSLLVSLSLQVNRRTLGDGDAIRSHHPIRPLITGKQSEVELIDHWTEHQTKTDGIFHGATAKIDIYDLTNLTGHQSSHALITLWNDENEAGNTISAGVHVYPELYNDTKVHFFTSWSADDSGCFNLLCPGFVKVNSSAGKPGGLLNPPSVYGGEQRYFTITIKKDESTGDWSLYRDDLGGRVLVGYWPKTLFSNLADAATRVTWGGQVTFAKNEKSPPMGSGHFSEEGEGKAAFFKNIGLYNAIGDLVSGLKTDIKVFNDEENCYSVSKLKESDEAGFFFYYGGPGGCN